MKTYKMTLSILFFLGIHCHINALPHDVNYHPMPPAINPHYSEHQTQAHFNTDFVYEMANAILPIYNQMIISKHDYTFENHFDVDSNMGHLGNIIETSFSLRKNYAYYNQHGHLISSAYVRVLSLGTLFTSATTMDIYDAEGEAIGVIEGSLLTTSPAKFYFYDGDNDLTGIAYLDNDRCSFTVFHPKHSKKIIAIFTRVFVRDVQDWWVVDIIDHEAIDYRILATSAHLL